MVIGTKAPRKATETIKRGRWITTDIRYSDTQSVFSEVHIRQANSGSDVYMRLSDFLGTSGTSIPSAKGEFEALAEEWRNETGGLSSVIQMATHPAYRKIISMDSEIVVPLILKELQKRPDHWFWALIAITGENPVNPDDAGDLDKMTKTWLDWGRKKGFI